MHFQSIERFLHWLEALAQTHGWFAIGGFTAGCLFVGVILGIFHYRHFRRAQRIVALAEERNVSELVVRSVLSAVTVRRTPSQSRVPHGYALQAPATRGQNAMRQTVFVENGQLTYYFPENDPQYPEGLQFPATANWIVGQPPLLTIPVDITPVTVPGGGTWLPAIVENATGLAHARHLVPHRKYWNRGYRNVFVGDFVAAGDPVGSIRSRTGLHRATVVTAPTSGFILQFGAQPYTELASLACAMLLGTPHDMRELTYQGDYAGFFRPAEEHAKTFVGSVVEPGTHLGSVWLLMGSIEERVTAPVRCRIVRQHIPYNASVQYQQTLFTYIPI